MPCFTLIWPLKVQSYMYVCLVVIVCIRSVCNSTNERKMQFIVKIVSFLLKEYFNIISKTATHNI